MSFEWNVVVGDYQAWIGWMAGKSGGPTKSWSTWWDDDNSFYKNLTLSSKFIYLVKAVLYVLIGNGIRISDFYKADITLYKPAIGIGKVAIVIGVLTLGRAIFNVSQNNLPYAVRQTISIIIFLGLATGILVLFLEDSDCIRYTISLYYMVGALCQVGLLAGVKIVKPFYFVHDVFCGHVIFIPLFFLAALQFFHHIQTWLLYHNALSSDVVVGDILRYAQRSQKSDNDDGELLEQVSELRKIVQKQEALLKTAGLLGEQNKLPSNMSTDAFTALAAKPQKEEVLNRPTNPPQSGTGVKKTLSMSGLDIWGPMAIGDTGDSEERRGTDSSMSSMQYSQNQSQSAETTGFSFSSPDTMPPR